MTIIQLRYFVMVCETGNITLAAELLFVTQPAISKALRELEQEWGIKLFVRQSNRLDITKKGKLAYEKAKELLAHADRFNNEVKSLEIKDSKLTFVLNSTSSMLFWPTLIKRFHDKYPKISIRLIEVQEHADAVLATDPDADILIMPNGQHHINEKTIKKIHLLDTEFVLLVGNKSSLKKYKTINDKVISDKPVIVDYYPRDLYEYEKFAPKRLVHFLNGNYVIKTSSQLTLNYQQVANNDAYTFTIKEIAKRYNDIISIPFDPPWIQKYDLYYPKIKSDKYSIKQFVEFAKNYDFKEI